MKKHKSKINVRFYRLFIYHLLFWIFLLVGIFTFSIYLTDLTLYGYAIGSTFLIMMAIVFIMIRNTRKQSLFRGLKITPVCLSLSNKEIHHYMGLKDDCPFRDEYCEMCNRYIRMSKAKLSYLILDSEKATEYRSGNTNYITTESIKFKLEACPLLYLKLKVPTFFDNKGAKYFLYPDFVIRIAKKSDITAFGYDKFEHSFDTTNYVLGYDEKIPKDAERTGVAYKYQNYNGTPDKRYADNPCSPKIKVAEINFEEYGIAYALSNVKIAEEFSDALDDFCEAYNTNSRTNTAAKMVVEQLKTDLENGENYFDIKNEEKKNFPETAKSSKQSDNPYEELDNLIGLNSVKKEIQSLANLVKVQKAREYNGLKNASMSYHLVLSGNPGTGKTTIARIIASIYRDLGILKKGHLIETDRSGLVAEYLGQTAIKTNQIIDSALDGVLFIDEAYSLSDDDDSYGSEAISTLIKRMEDNRDRLVVILAGYTENMKTFIGSNPGLESRFKEFIEFPDYSESELFEIFMTMINKYEYSIADDAIAIVKTMIYENLNNKNSKFGNARFIRNIFEKIISNQANRLAKDKSLSSDKLSQINLEDCCF